MTLKFHDLLFRALSEWPAEIDLVPLVRSVPPSSGYIVSGLGEMSDAIEAKHIGAADEIVMRNLHYAIYRAVHGVAAHIVRVRTSDLRSDAIQRELEEAITDCMEMADLGYSPEAIELGKRYFAENGTEA